MENITGNRIKDLRLNLNLTQEKLGNILHVTKQSVSKWERGENIPEPPILKKLANMFNCSTDYLLGTTDIKNYSNNISADNSKLDRDNSLKLTKKDEKDIARMLEQTKEMLESSEGLMFDGEPASEEAIQSILQAMEMGMALAKQKNKEKYTPKKYRRDNK